MEQVRVTKIEKIALKLLEQLKSEGLSFRDAQLVVSQTANLLNREMEKRIF